MPPEAVTADTPSAAGRLLWLKPELSPAETAKMDAWVSKNLPKLHAIAAAPEGASRLLRQIRWAQDFAAITLLGTGYAVTSFLIVLGAPLFVFLLLVGWDLGLLLGGVGDLADHYRAASPLQRLAFSRDALALFLVAVGLVALLRLPRCVRELGELLDRSREP